jgi:ribose transport system substrate-binding protein
MKFFRLMACLLLAFAPSLLLFGCGPKGPKLPKVAFVTNNSDPFWNLAEAGAKKAAEENGVELIFRMPQQGESATQKEVIDTILSQDVKAIAVSVIDPKNQGAYLDEIAAKVPLLTVDNDAPKTKRLAYIGTRNYQAGRAAGKLVKEALGKEGGTVVIFVGQLEPLNARQRRQGVIDELAGRPPLKDPNDFEDSPDGETYGNIKTYEKTYTDQPEGEQKAKENAEDALEQLKKVKNVCMVGLWAYNPPAILNAATDKKKLGKIKIVGFDERPQTLDGILDGTIHATVVQNPYQFGYQSVAKMAAIAKGETPGLPKDGVLEVPYRVIAKEAGEKNGMKRLSVKQFREELNRLLGK